MMANGEKIIVVDDEPAVRELLVDILSDEGYALESSAEADSALEKMRAQQFDLLLTDIRLPGMNGIELMREAMRVLPDIIPVVMTGNATLDTARAAVRGGAFDYVLKPFDIAEVRIAVAGALERKRLLDENARLRELGELFMISETINSLREEKTLLEFVLKSALAKVGAARGSIMLRDRDGDTLRIAVSVGVPDDVKGSAVVKLGEGISGWVAKEGKPLLIADIEQDAQFKDVSNELPDKSFVSVPIETHDEEGVSLPVKSSKQVLGVMNVNRKRNGHPFTASDLKTLSILANQAAVSLDNARLFASLQDAYLMTIRSLVLALEAKDAYTHGHSQRVTAICERIGTTLEMSSDELDCLRTAATLHDIGKIAIPETVLNKPGPLNDAEWDMLRRHPAAGCEVLAPVTFLTPAMPIIRHHHERQDGKGYPDGIEADTLSKSIRTIIVADAYDAMASDRAYRGALSDAEIESQLTKNSGTQFDPEIVAIMLELHRNGEFRSSGEQPPQSSNQKT